MLKYLLLLVVLLTQAVIIGEVYVKTEEKSTPNVFIDCSRCDINFIREQVSFVNYVRDRNDSDVHIQINNIRTGGGGSEYTLTFIGKNGFSAHNDTLSYSVSESETADNSREVMVKYIKLGLMKYISNSSVADNIEINYNMPNSNTKISEMLDADWNYWVFRTRFSGWIQGEKSTSNFVMWGSFSLSRITDELKVRFSLNGNYNEENYDYDNETYTSISRQQSFRSSIIVSHNDNWSYGIFGSLYSSIYDNIRFNTSVSPGIEYNFFPYNESTRRQLRFAYRVAFDFNKYDEETVYFQTEELLIKERFSISLDIIQDWGNIETVFLASHYMHDLNLHFLQLTTEFRINIVTGLTLDMFGRLAYIHDQIALPKTGVNLEEVLLKQKQLETNYDYRARFGFTYSFGSIYNNIVNTRFGY